MTQSHSTLAFLATVVMVLLLPSQAKAVPCWGSLWVANKVTTLNAHCPQPTLTKTWTIDCISGCGYTTRSINSLVGAGDCVREGQCDVTIVCLPLNGVDIRYYIPPSLSSSIANRTADQSKITCEGYCFTYSVSTINIQCPCDEEASPGSCVGNDPLIVSLGDLRYLLTDLNSGVRFDLGGDGAAEQTAWTDRRGDEAFLFLDRNGNGMVDDGTELFGDATPQHASPTPNGFLALAMFDDSLSGGNEDGRISAEDRVFPQLQLWKDRNHDGVSTPNELFWLSEFGLEWIDLSYERSTRADRYGNEFRYLAESGWADGSTRAVWNVFFVTE